MGSMMNATGTLDRHRPTGPGSIASSDRITSGIPDPYNDSTESR